MKRAWLFALILVPLITIAQESLFHEKLSPNYSSDRRSLSKFTRFHIATSDLPGLSKILRQHRLDGKVLVQYLGVVVLEAPWKTIDSLVLPSPKVQFVEPVRVPKEEAALNEFDLSTNSVNQVHEQFFLSGIGMVASVKENRPDTTDIDLRGRWLPNPLASPFVNSHATTMSTIIGGAGNSFYTGKGVAWGTSITSSNFATLLPDQDASYQQSGVTIQNHSYGTGVENYYGADASAYDESAIRNPALLHVFSSGNSGDRTSTAGNYTGIPTYANLTGSFKMAKNIITVGAVDSFYNVAFLSSKGPGFDGRIKPEISAFSLDGTSGAAAIVSGTALLLQELYKQKNANALPPSSLVKAILLNTADDVGRKEVDYQTGFGNLNAFKAMKSMNEQKYFSNSTNGQQQTYTLTLPSGIRKLKITLCWTDPAALPNTSKALVNDLDMKLVHQSGNSWLPWVLSSFPHLDSISKPAQRNRDTLNNVEQITLDNPEEGLYTIFINGNLKSGPQQYHISYHLELENSFQWYYPTTKDFLQPGKNAVLRFQSGYEGNATLEYSLNKGASWSVISTSVNLSQRYYQWKVPDVVSAVMFRMKINNDTYLSDTSIISKLSQLQVGFNCIDSILLFWDKSNSPPYTVYTLGEKYLEPIATTTDTSIVLKKPLLNGLYYAVAPNVNGLMGLKSYTINYLLQGVGCYIKSFLVDLVNNEARIKLELGSQYDIDSLILEKSGRTGFTRVRYIPLGSSLSYAVSDNELQSGGNTYRIRIVLANGRSIYTSSETVYYLPSDYLLFPNPAKGRIQIISKSDDVAVLNIYNSTGQKIMERKITERIQTILLAQLRRGVYYVMITREGKKAFLQPIVIQ